MIKKAQTSDIEQLTRIYSGFYEPKYVSFFFEHVFKPFNTYVIKNEQQILATVTVNRHPVMIADKKINVSFLSNLYISNDAKTDGLGRIMLDEVMEEMSYNDLLTMIFTKDIGNYINYGFKPIYRQRHYSFTREHIPIYSDIGITNEVNVQQLKQLYQQFTSYFDGYYHRDKDYYTTKKQLINVLEYKLVAYQDDDGKITGYMIYERLSNKIVVKELIYLNSVAFIKLLNHVLHLSPLVDFTLPNGINVNRIIPSAQYEIMENISVRLNDKPLFERLFNTKITMIDDVFDQAQKPLFINEDY